MKLAATCGLFQYNKEVANELKPMSTPETGGYRKNHERVPKRRHLAIKTLRWMMKEIGVEFRMMEGGVTINSLCSSSLVEERGLLFDNIVDQNGTAGHFVVIDLFRKVIIDPAEECEVDLDRCHILKCAGTMSVCIEFKDVLKIQSIRGVSFVKLNHDLRFENKRVEENEKKTQTAERHR